ncbi:MAG: NYN domain-containing protein [Eubacterium sp.]|nr:NYN domain-containing protein [Eubacterium sp.]
MTIDDLCEEDFNINFQQKGVDMKIGIDITSMAYKQQVDQIILIAGDSDFVPAAKLARREGIDFILDPMWNKIKPSLFEHIDGLNSQWGTRHDD